MNRERVLIDSDALVALTIEGDSNHFAACEIKREFENESFRLMVINLVLQETVTVLSHRTNQAIAIKFYDSIQNDFPKVIFIDEILEKKAYEFFVQQTKKGTSFVDCANMAVMGQLKINTIFSFDKIYKTNGFKRAGID